MDMICGYFLMFLLDIITAILTYLFIHEDIQGFYFE